MADRIFKRKIYEQIRQWKEENNGGSALLIEGARRVGKSTIVEQFARNESLTESSEGFLKNLIASVRSFTGDNPQNDDITVMAIKL